MRVVGDQSRCVGTGNCAFAAAGVFDQDDETGLVVVLDAEPDESQARAVRQAVRECPAGAIAVTDD